MAVENFGDGGRIITGSDVQVFQYLRVAAGLAMEINTGLKMSRGGSVMKLAAGMCGSDKRTKRGVLVDYVVWLEETLPGYEPNPRVKQAMQEK